MKPAPYWNITIDIIFETIEEADKQFESVKTVEQKLTPKFDNFLEFYGHVPTFQFYYLLYVHVDGGCICFHFACFSQSNSLGL